jgi:hypothetical protein
MNDLKNQPIIFILLFLALSFGAGFLYGYRRMPPPPAYIPVPHVSQDALNAVSRATSAIVSVTISGEATGEVISRTATELMLANPSQNADLTRNPPITFEVSPEKGKEADLTNILPGDRVKIYFHLQELGGKYIIDKVQKL